ncbi:hypothetical protein CONPUDRAFT_114374 [Coniophora puteana RWD-64-598 SS2]|uniref:Ribosomal protein/NADH dehydrogenase domain-containing protein n=1 Tax=Coniophora puteana (strain RWD-64-598) TaxID=741705 RepID=A0A5M3N4C3_CONPW|nr:uncharacterized protein CONPUDRAFT_114374 [Coniophora puteana RWD-64-598 SS2]EIW86243.1 hypothetical protein CONPUDRAFT_114374 [Coniophora puteana RWD-64-598 SS2]
MVKTLPGPSRLSQTLLRLKAAPRLELLGLKRLRVSFGAKEANPGTRHFLKEELPRIRFANPALEIEVDQHKDARPQPSLTVEQENGSTTVIAMEKKWSSVIVKELMDLAGGDAWAQHKAAATAAGQPILPGEEERQKALETVKLQRATRAAQPKVPERPRTGAAAMLP